jgi:hypothetical protein
MTKVYHKSWEESVEIVMASVAAFNRIPHTQDATWHSNGITLPEWLLSVARTDPIVKRMVEKIIERLSQEQRNDIKVLALGAGAGEVFVDGPIQSGWFGSEVQVINVAGVTLPHGSQIGNSLFRRAVRDHTLRCFNEMAAHLLRVSVIDINDALSDELLVYTIGLLPTSRTRHDTFVTSDGAVHTLDGRLIAEAGLDEDTVRGLRRYVEENELSNRELGYLAVVLRTVLRHNLQDVTEQYTCAGCAAVSEYAYYNMQCQRNGCHGYFLYSHSHNGFDPYYRRYCDQTGCHAAGRCGDDHKCSVTRTYRRFYSLTPPPGYIQNATRRFLVVRKKNAETGDMVAHALVGAPAIAQDMLDVMQPIWDHHYSNRIRHPLNWRGFIQCREHNWTFRYGSNGKKAWPDQLASVGSLELKLTGNQAARGRMPPTVIGAGLHGGEIRLGDFIYEALPYHEGVEENEEEESSDGEE